MSHGQNQFNSSQHSNNTVLPHSINWSGRGARLLSAAVCLIVKLTLPAAAHAEIDRNWYSTLGFGVNYADVFRTADPGGRIDYDFGLPAVSLSFGGNLSDHYRLELELNHQEDEPEILYIQGSDVEIDPLETNHLATTSLLVNLIRDFRVGLAFRPYLGLGAGPARIKVKFSEKDDPMAAPILDDQTSAFAYQVIAGISLPLSRKFALGIDYRYWQAPRVSVTDRLGNSIHSQQAIHSARLNLAYAFGKGNPKWADVPAHPAPRASGFYASGLVGGTWPRDTDLMGIHETLDAFDKGPMAALALGYRLGGRWRLELEAARRSNDMQVYDRGFPVGENRTEGDTRSDSLILNATYRFRPNSAINPVVGAGFGLAKVRHRIQQVEGNLPLINDSGTGMAAQLLFGFDVAVTKRWTVSTGYRWWFTDKIDFTTTSGAKVNSDLSIHGVTVGVRYGP